MAEQKVVVELLEDGEAPEDEGELDDNRWVVPRTVVRLTVVVVWCCPRCRVEGLEVRT